MSGTLIVVIFIGLIAVIVTLKSIIIVPSGTVVLVERLGKFHGKKHGGVHILIPFLDRVAHRFLLADQQIKIPATLFICSDGDSVSISGELTYRVINPEKAAYSVSELDHSLVQLTNVTLRSQGSKFTSQDLNHSFGDLEAKTIRDLDAGVEPWGVKPLRFKLSRDR